MCEIRGATAQMEREKALKSDFDRASHSESGFARASHADKPSS
jgi:hypothetical protein